MLADAPFEKVCARLLWDAGRVDLEGAQASMEKVALAGKRAVSLRHAPRVHSNREPEGNPMAIRTVAAEGTPTTSGAGLRLRPVGEA